MTTLLYDHAQAVVRTNMQTFCEGKLIYTEVTPATDGSGTVAMEVSQTFVRPPPGPEAHGRALAALGGLKAQVKTSLEDFARDLGSKGLRG